MVVWWVSLPVSDTNSSDRRLASWCTRIVENADVVSASSRSPGTSSGGLGCEGPSIGSIGLIAGVETAGGGVVPSPAQVTKPSSAAVPARLENTHEWHFDLQPHAEAGLEPDAADSALMDRATQLQSRAMDESGDE